MTDDTNVDETRMKMCFIDFTTEMTDGINVERSSMNIMIRQSLGLPETLKEQIIDAVKLEQ